MTVTIETQISFDGWAYYVGHNEELDPSELQAYLGYSLPLRAIARLRKQIRDLKPGQLLKVQA